MVQTSARGTIAERETMREPGAGYVVVGGRPDAYRLATLARYRGLLRELDEIVILLHEHSRQPWAQDALRALRRGLADAADVQGRLVDEMLTV